MTDEQFSNLIPNKSKVKIKGEEIICTVIGFLLSTEPPIGYLALLSNNKDYLPEYLDLIE